VFTGPLPSNTRYSIVGSFVSSASREKYTQNYEKPNPFITWCRDYLCFEAVSKDGGGL
jgi:hypothetical protein